MIAPIATLHIGDDDSLMTVLHAPGLPPGAHKLYCDPWEGWQPIETKPPNQRVLLWFPELGYPVTGDSEVYSYVSGGWKATLWMPLPASPGNSSGN